MLSSTVMWENRLKDWNTMPIRLRSAASCRPSWGRGTPSIRISPESMVSSRLTVRHRVDLPEPEGPMITTTSPFPTDREMSFNTWRSP